MIVVGWTVAFQKFNYLNIVQKATRAFLCSGKLSADLTALDHNDPAGISSLEGGADDRTRDLIKRSPLYQNLPHWFKGDPASFRPDKDRTKDSPALDPSGARRARSWSRS
jgi:biopolymer transport protein ExbB